MPGTVPHEQSRTKVWAAGQSLSLPGRNAGFREGSHHLLRGLLLLLHRRQHTHTGKTELWPAPLPLLTGAPRNLTGKS